MAVGVIDILPLYAKYSDGVTNVDKLITMLYDALSITDFVYQSTSSGFMQPCYCLNTQPAAQVSHIIK